MEQYLFLATVLILSLAFVKLWPRNNGENLPPGPWQLPVIGSLHHLAGKLPHRAMRDLARRHGELMLLRLGELPVVVASSPAAARELPRSQVRDRRRGAGGGRVTGSVTATRSWRGWRTGVKVAAGFTLADVFPSSRLARVLSGAARRAEAHSREMTRLMDGVIEEHRQRRAATGWRDEDLLDVLLRIQKDGGLQIPLDMGTIRAVIIDLFSAGSETTGTTLQWAMAELMRNPAALRKAQAEVRGVLAGHTHVTEDALPDLHYLHLVIKETLRLHVAVPLLLPRECQEPRRRVLGYDVPERAMVLVNAWAICRDAAVWGPDAEEFRPERFDGGGAVDFRGTDFEFVPFGAGRRMCPGVAFAVAIMELGLASLLFHFDWELAGGAAAAGELDMAEGLGITARRKSDLWLHATVRVPVPNTETS
uniref:Cytochrome P450 n=1 Tax=Oryza barthii TaxID=65489 RepID=A0A0D3GJ54_9ORYZ